MKKIIYCFIAIILSVTLFSSCDAAGSVNLPTDNIQSEQSSSGITQLKFSSTNASLQLNAGETSTGYFVVKGNENFSIDDIEFVSSDSSIATFSYDKTALKTCVYYKITAISSGTAEIYAQTTDGKVSTEKISVIVSGYQYEIANMEDNSLPNVKRHTIRATVDESLVEGKSNEHISNLMKYIVSQYASAHDVNSIQLLLYVTGDDTSGVATVGSCNYAPYGDLNWASEVKAGDYSTFELCDVHINSKELRDTYRGK